MLEIIDNMLYHICSQVNSYSCVKSNSSFIVE